MCRRGILYGSHAELTDLIMTSLQCPWLMRCCPTKGKKERRADNVRAPCPTPNVVIYRSDGASRGQGASADSVAGWGAAVWTATADGQGVGPPAATARGFLGIGVSNNFAEYSGLLACMERAARSRDLHIIFEVDSMLLAKQLARYRPWACRSENLVGLHRLCVDIGERLETSNVTWNIRHIHREFNQVSDSLSNQAIDEQATNGSSIGW